MSLKEHFKIRTGILKIIIVSILLVPTLLFVKLGGGYDLSLLDLVDTELVGPFFFILVTLFFIYYLIVSIIFYIIKIFSKKFKK